MKQNRENRENRWALWGFFKRSADQHRLRAAYLGEAGVLGKRDQQLRIAKEYDRLAREAILQKQART